MSKIAVLSAIILALIIVPTSIFALQNPKNLTETKTPEEIAVNYIKNSPTFKFDGITSSVVVEDIYLNKSNPPQYVVTLSFQCLHSGYGNRAGKVLLQVITPHTAVVTINAGVVLSAVVDNIWDEIGQRNVEHEYKKYVEAVALNWLINAPTFKFNGIKGSIKVVDSWLAMTFAAPSFWGVTIEFECAQAGYGDRTGQMLNQVITQHVAMIHVTEGVVTFAIIDDKWNELKQQPTQNVYTVEMAEQTALTWLMNCPTFKFDGNKDSIKITSSEILEKYPVLYVYKIGFTSSSAGYGDRSGSMVAQVLTDHTVKIQIENGVVLSAVIDEVWDELKQEFLQNNYTAEMATQTALDWLKTHPTFKFDGISETVKVGEVRPLRMLYAWEIFIDFTCNYPGYGDRTGNTMLGHSQSHTIRITVIKGQVTRAIIDEVWDEMNQVMIEDSPILGADETRDIVVKYLIDKLGLNYQLPEVWMVEDLNPQVLGYESTRYIGGDWIVTVEFPVVYKPIFTVTVEVNQIKWSGKVDPDGVVIPGGDNPESSPRIYTPDIARDMCLDYLMIKHPEIAREIPLEWKEKNIVPDGIVGITKIEYTSNGWSVIVSAPVVWKPTHTVSISYKAEGVSFAWEGQVPQGCPVIETSFSK